MTHHHVRAGMPEEFRARKNLGELDGSPWLPPGVGAPGGSAFPARFPALRRGRAFHREKALPEVASRQGFPMSGRLDSNQRPPEPHSWRQGRSQPPDVTNASLLETYRFHSSHSLRRSQRKINDLPTFSRVFPAQACPHQCLGSHGYVTAPDEVDHVVRQAHGGLSGVVFSGAAAPLCGSAYFPGPGHSDTGDGCLELVSNPGVEAFCRNTRDTSGRLCSTT
jgi:hypothetical protein